MSTTHLPAGPDGKATPERLAYYLTRRAELAANWAERMSHGFNVGDATRDLVVIETALAHCWPDVYARSWRRWSLEDAALLHADDRREPTCSICNALPEPTQAA